MAGRMCSQNESYPPISFPSINHVIKATRQFTKQYNRQLVLKTVFSCSGISRADIARKTGLTRTTVSEIVADLISEGLVEEIGVGSSAGGKPPIKVAVLDDARQTICLDLSKQSVCGAIVNLRGQVSQRSALPLPRGNSEEFLKIMCDELDRLLSLATAPVLGIGIGTPGMVDIRRGVVRKAVNLALQDIPLKRLLSERYRLPIYLANDGQVAAMAEYTYGGYGELPNLVVIKAGEGIGSGIVISGEIFYGDGFAAGEIGHLGVIKNGLECTCGNRGCLETVSSSRAILRQIRDLALSGPEELAPELRRQDLTLSDVARAYQAESPAVTRVIHGSAAYLGMAVAHVCSVLNIRNVIIAGDLVELGIPFLAAVQQAAQECMMPGLFDETDIRFSTLGADHVILGASALVLSQELKLP